jgi:hypothetical protein
MDMNYTQECENVPIDDNNAPLLSSAVISQEDADAVVEPEVKSQPKTVPEKISISTTNKKFKIIDEVSSSNGKPDRDFSFDGIDNNIGSLSTMGLRKYNQGSAFD